MRGLHCRLFPSVMLVALGGCVCTPTSEPDAALARRDVGLAVDAATDAAANDARRDAAAIDTRPDTSAVDRVGADHAPGRDAHPTESGSLDTRRDDVGPHCGNRVPEPPAEVCDDGTLNGIYGYCRADCQGPGEHCGDGIKNGPELCDGADVPSCTDLGYDRGVATCAASCDRVNPAACELDQWRLARIDDAGDNLLVDSIDLARVDFKVEVGELMLRIAAYAPFAPTHPLNVALADLYAGTSAILGVDEQANIVFQVWDQNANDWADSPAPASLVVDTSRTADRGVLVLRVALADLPNIDLGDQFMLAFVGTYRPGDPVWADMVPALRFMPLGWLDPIAVCGDGQVEFPEPCDGVLLAGQSCESSGNASGLLACNACGSLDASACSGTVTWQTAGTDPAGDNPVTDFDPTQADFRVDGDDLYLRISHAQPFDPSLEVSVLLLVDPNGHQLTIEWHSGLVHVWSSVGGWHRMPRPPSLVINPYGAPRGEPVYYRLPLSELPDLDTSHQALRIHYYVWSDWSSEQVDEMPDNAATYRDLWVLDWNQGPPICGNGVIEAGEECDALDVGGASCQDFGLPGTTPVCSASCTLLTGACGFCDRWTLAAVDQPDDHVVGAVDGNLLEYRAATDNSALHFRLTTAAPFDAARYWIMFELWDGTRALTLESYLAQPYTFLYDGQDWIAIDPVPASFLLDTSRAATGGVIEVAIAPADVGNYLSGIDQYTTIVSAYILDASGRTLDSVPDGGVYVRWAARMGCWLTLDSSPDRKGDTDGSVDFAALTYNLVGDWFEVTAYYYADPTLDTRTVFHLYNETDDKLVGFALADQGVMIGQPVPSWTWSQAPAGCLSQRQVASSGVAYASIACPVPELEQQLAGVGFDFDDTDVLRLGAGEMTGPTIHDRMPDGWTSYSQLEEITVWR